MKTLTPENCLSATYPLVAAQWSNRNTLTPYDVFPGSNTKAWFKCPAGVHEDAFVLINSRRSGCGCNECGKIAGMLPKPGCSFAELYPELLKQWSPKNVLNPYQLLPKSARFAIWICESGHEWESVVHNIANGRRCPFCSHHRVTVEHSIAVIGFHLVIQWHPDNALTPDKVAAFSNLESHWLCDICRYDWYASPATRMAGSRCISCNPTGTSYEEELVIALLSEALNVEIYQDVRLASRVIVDGFIPEFNAAIDYDGIYWHGQNGSLEQDTRKTASVTALGYRMIRIRPDPLLPVPGAEHVAAPEPSTFLSLAIAAADIIDPNSAPHSITEDGILRAQAAARRPIGPRATIPLRPSITDKVEVQLVEQITGT